MLRGRSNPLKYQSGGRTKERVCRLYRKVPPDYELSSIANASRMFSTYQRRILRVDTSQASGLLVCSACQVPNPRISYTPCRS
jgi:hypothetical protein